LKAGHCLTTYAEKDGKRLIAVVLNAPSPYACYNDTLKLLEYGFKTLKPVKVVARNKVLATDKLLNPNKFSLKALTDLNVLLPANYNPSNLNYSFIDLYTESRQSIGILKVYYEGHLVGITVARKKRNNP
jgi:D-alanyl-D-alanine carboxypeptidase